MYPDAADGPLRPDLAVVVCEECERLGKTIAMGADDPDAEIETCEHCGGSGQCEDRECDCGEEGW